MIFLDRVIGAIPAPRSELLGIIKTSPLRYRVYEIKKRSGGTRTIAQPSREVKLLQRFAVSLLREVLPIHKAATAYEPGSTIKKHALQHAQQKYLLKLDFVDFFGSLRASDFSYLIRRARPAIENEEIDLLCRLLYRFDRVREELRLSVGAPSSPFVSNAIMFAMDSQISQYCSERYIRYSRYADDIALSTNTPHILDDANLWISELLARSVHPKLQLNPRKTVFTSRKFNRTLTGLVLTNDGKVSIGRAKKRELRASVHRYLLGKLSGSELSSLRGMISYVNSVEPSFLRSLEGKYGDKPISALLHGL